MSGYAHLEVARDGPVLTIRINRVVAPGAPESKVAALAAPIAAIAPLSVKMTKQMMRRGLENSSLQAAFAAGYPAYDAMLASEDAVEGPHAFAEKRKPIWPGR